ncbi:MAG: hypothetical protein HZB26_21400, partial [Candidatus Hydrogenedentes bacterium]|nr:hypothetical protein [Candidatus Hydrogenedentota bacterium]
MAHSMDYALAGHRDDWLRHPVYGDPSFDTFERATGNPIHRGAPPWEWPVNGFLFDDPVSGDWFVYVGLYAKGYAMGPHSSMGCTVYRSKDRGRTWKDLGPTFPPEPFFFTGDVSPVGHAPDVSVMYANGRYHMVYDYATANSTWETAMNPANGADNGIGYAWSEHPEGPYHRTPEPVYRTSAHAPMLGKYRRGYAATLLRRKHDWIVLAMSDSGPNMSWALMGMTASNPEGPYSAPVLLRCVDELTYHPPLLEFYPAFQHDGHIYAPATSVALNRNFQAVFRVKTENAMNPDAWELFQDGSVWHAAPVENEAYGIWGQTFTGFVDRTNAFHVMYPSRDPQGMGTINLAARPWKQPYHAGFAASAHEGSSLALLKKSYGEFALDTEFELHGTASFVFGYQAPLGPNKPTADATLHPLSLTRYNGLELTPDAWRVVRVDEHGNRSILAEQPHTQAPLRKIRLRQSAQGRLEVSLHGATAWTGDFAGADGLVGLVLAPHSHIAVKRFEV